MTEKPDMLVLQADTNTIKFVVQDDVGSPVHIVDENGVLGTIPLLREDDIQPGMCIAVPSLFGGYTVARVEPRDLAANQIATAGVMIWILEFAQDHRKCWICVGTANKRELKKLDIFSGNGNM